jgi:hypothetical protein
VTASCLIDGCNGQCHAKGWCKTHYDRWRRHGNPLAVVREVNPTAKRAWINSASRSTTDGCIDWPWGQHNGGYGHVAWNGSTRPVHTIVCETAHGPRPIGMEAAHSCGRPICANPAHLRWATPKENSNDKIAHGTDLRGERSPHAELTWYAVHWIRSLYATGDYLQRELGEMFGVTHNHISDIVNHKRWATQ